MRFLRRYGDLDDMSARTACKAISRGIANHYRKALDKTVEECGNIIDSRGFLETLLRFIPNPMATQTVDDAGFRTRLASTIKSLCENTRQFL